MVSKVGVYMNLYKEGVEFGEKSVLEMMRYIIDTEYDSFEKPNALYLFEKVRRVFSEVKLDNED